MRHSALPVTAARTSCNKNFWARHDLLAVVIATCFIVTPALGQQKPQHDGRPATAPKAASRPRFAPLIPAQFRERVAALGDPARTWLAATLDLAPLYDNALPALQLVYGNDLLEIVGMMRPRLKGNDWTANLVEVLAPNVDALQNWIATNHNGGGTTLEFAAKGGDGRAFGFRTIPWGPIRGWSADVVLITFDDGVVFTRKSKAYSQPYCLTSFFSRHPAAGEAYPPIDMLSGDIDVFESSRPVDGAEGTRIRQLLLVVDGSLEAASTYVTPVNNATLPALTANWHSVLNDLGNDAYVLSTTQSDTLVRSSCVTWNRPTSTSSPLFGIVSAFVHNEISEADVRQRFGLVGSDAGDFVYVKTCSSVVATDQIREAIAEWTHDLPDTTEAQRAALLPGNDQLVLVIEIFATGKDRSRLCSPSTTLVDANGRRYSEIGDQGRLAVLRGLRARYPEIPEDLSMLTLAKINAGMQQGIQESHGSRARVFYVPAGATRLSFALDECTGLIGLPDMPPAGAFFRKPCVAQFESTLDGSTLLTDSKTACMTVFQWSASITRRAADAAAAAAAARAAVARAESESAAAAEEVKRREDADKQQKLEKSFD